MKAAAVPLLRWSLPVVLVAATALLTFALL